MSMQKQSKVLLSRVAIWELEPLQEEKEEKKEQQGWAEPDILKSSIKRRLASGIVLLCEKTF